MNFKNFRSFMIATFIFSCISGCASMGERVSSSMSADQTAQKFFNNLERSKRKEAYDLFAKGLSQTISFNKFDEFMDTLQEKWGRITEEQTEVMPFHTRAGESDFIPLNTPPEAVKRYTYNVKFENAELNFDLTLVPDGEEYKIVWISIWGSSIYMTAEINNKVQELFEKPADTEK